MGVDRTGVIRLAGLRARGTHGVFDFERADGQEFIVDLAIEVDMPANDDIAATVDYGELATKVVGIIAGDPVNLIETLAEQIAASVLADQRIRHVQVTVHKPQAPIEARFDDVAVTISRRNHV